MHNLAHMFCDFFLILILGTFDNKPGISPDRLTSRALKRTYHVEHTTH
jgi:hypothetical protein